MTLSIAQQRTTQFYNWEIRCRGWQWFDTPIALEPTYEPFIFRPTPVRAHDDGYRPTLASTVVDFLKGKQRTKEVEPTPDENHYDIAPILFDHDAPLRGIRISFDTKRPVSPLEMEQLFCMLSFAAYPISFEIIGTHTEIYIQIVCREPDLAHTQSQVKAFFPDCILTDCTEEIPDIMNDEGYAYIVDFGLAEEFMRPIAMSDSFKLDPYIGLFGILEHLKEGEQAVLQVLFQGAVNPWTESIIHSVSDGDGKSFFADAPEMVTLAHEKVAAPLFGVTLRIIGQSDSEEQALSLTESLASAICHLSRSPTNALGPLITEAYSFELRFRDVLLRQSHRSGMILNSRELSTLAHVPSDSVAASKLNRERTKTKAAPSIARGHPLVLGSNYHHGTEVPASLATLQRLKHMHVIGATGTGKSTFLLNLIAQDMEQGNGIAVLDPHGDLIETILAYVPEERIGDVMVIDPADAEFPVAFNILSAHSDIEKDTLSSDLVAVFKRLSTSWGDQMNAVLANAILAFLESTKGGTLVDLRRFLVEKSFRDAFLKTVTDPSIIYYWNKEYPLLKSSSIGSILTRLDTFLRPKLIRNMVAQRNGPDFEWILDSKKILLVKLSQGLIGTENSYMLGTFIVSKIHQAAMARQATHKDLRSDYFVYIDEFQNFITPSLSSILSGARKYHIGLVLAHQDMQQLSKYDTELASSVAANAGTRVCFRLGDTDAKRFESTFSSFEASDLQNLDTGEAIVRIERPEYDFTISTSPLPNKEQSEIERLTNLVVSHSRKMYGSERSVVEAQLFEELSGTIEVPEPPKTNEEKTVVESVVPEKEEPVHKDSPVEFRNPTPPQTKETKPIPPKEILKKPASEKKEKSTHRYLQTLIKKMAESRGYKASIEEPTPDGKGRVDVALERNGKKIACEISVTSTDIYEVHNIEKCLEAGYDLVIECSTERKVLEAIRKAIENNLSEEVRKKILVLEPNELFFYLDTEIAKDASTETRIKGYRVKVEYDAVSEDEMKKKRDVISEMVVKSKENPK